MDKWFFYSTFVHSNRMIKMDPIILTALCTTIGSAVTGFVTFLLTKKKYNIEVDNTYIQNMQKSLEFYEKLSDDNSKRLTAVLDRNQYLEERYLKVEERNERLEAEIEKVKTQMITVMGQICLNLACDARIHNPKLFGNKPNKNDK